VAGQWSPPGRKAKSIGIKSSPEDVNDDIPTHLYNKTLPTAQSVSGRMVKPVTVAANDLRVLQRRGPWAALSNSLPNHEIRQSLRRHTDTIINGRVRMVI
jgi:hypothetical protein